MTNTEIIYKAAIIHGIPQEQLDACLQRGDLPYHTAADWSKRGYQVRKDAAPLFDCYLWKHTNKPSAATIKVAEDAGKEAPKQSPHFYQKLSYIYGPAQVERTPAAPDLATLKARLDTLPGVTYKVKGEKTGSPNVWLSGDVDTHAETIKALGGIWSKKKSAYWIKPSTATVEDKPAAPVPSIMEDAPAAQAVKPCTALVPAPCTALVPLHYFHKPAPAPAQEASTQPAGPAPAPVPGPWKKCSFYTIRRDKEDDKQKPHKVDGYTDGIYNYYAIGTRSKTWHAIHPVYGLSIVWMETRQAAQARALELSDKIRDMASKPDARLQAYADMMKAAQDGGNLSLF